LLPNHQIAIYTQCVCIAKKCYHEQGQTVQIITVINQKGGVGKTTTSTNLSYTLAKMGKRVLLVDADPQANSSSIYIDTGDELDNTIREILVNKTTNVVDSIYPAMAEGAPIQNLDILPSNIYLARAAEQLMFKQRRERILEKALNKIQEQYDIILIDSQPSLSVLTVNTIQAANIILVPLNCSAFSLDGIRDLFEVIQEVKEDQSYQYFFLKNNFDKRETVLNTFADEQLSDYQQLMFNSVVRKSTYIGQAQVARTPVEVYQSSAPVLQDYKDLALELLEYANQE